MANYQTIAPLEGITGKLNKKGKTVFRQKFARDSNGAVIRPMQKEVYVIQNPRDWKKKPAKGAEKQKQDRLLLRKNPRMCLNEAHPRVFVLEKFRIKMFTHQ